jgi:transposase
VKFKYRVVLTPEEIKVLQDYISSGKCDNYMIKRCNCLLMTNDGVGDQEIAATLQLHRCTVEAVRKRFFTSGLDECVRGRPKRHKPPIMLGENEARLLALAGEIPEDGGRHRSLRKLSSEFTTVEGTKVSHETIRRTLKKAALKRGPKEE